MNTKILVASLATAGLASAFGASAAHAEGLKLGAQAQVLPFGSSLEIGDGDDSEDLDLSTAFGIVGTVDYAVHPNIDIGLAPRLVLNIIPDEADDDDDSATELDLAARVTGHALVAPKLDVFGYVAPGYSIVMLPEGDDDDAFDDPSGLILGLGAGVKYAVSPTLSVVGELGYQLGFQGTSIEFAGESFDADFKTNLVHFGVGIQAAL